MEESNNNHFCYWLLIRIGFILVQISYLASFIEMDTHVIWVKKTFNIIA